MWKGGGCLQYNKPFHAQLMYEVNHKKPFNGLKKEKTTFPVLIWDHSRPVTSYQLWNVVTHARTRALYSRQRV